MTATTGPRQGVSPTTSLPKHIDAGIRSGEVLVGDDFNEEQLIRWFAQEQEAFFSEDAGNSDRDPWYAYMRYLNAVLGFSAVRESLPGRESVLVLGPGSGVEIDVFAREHPHWALHFIEASDNFTAELKRKWPQAAIVPPQASGRIAVESESQSLVCAFSVLHHIPNVSTVLREIGRVTRRDGLVLVREPCSSMGDWRGPRSATPNERGISRKYLVNTAAAAGLHLEKPPIPILFEPLNKLLKRTIGYTFVPQSLLYRVDRLVSRLAAFNDHYWRDTPIKKFGPSSYFYLFRKR